MFSLGSAGLLELALDRAIRKLDDYEPGSAEYNKVMDTVMKLHRMKVEEKPESVNRDTLVIALTNLLGIVMIIGHERVNVVTSKAFGLLLRPR